HIDSLHILLEQDLPFFKVRKCLGGICIDHIDPGHIKKNNRVFVFYIDQFIPVFKCFFFVCSLCICFVFTEHYLFLCHIQTFHFFFGIVRKCFFNKVVVSNCFVKFFQIRIIPCFKIQ